MPDTFQSFSGKAKLTIAGVGIALASFCIGAALLNASETSEKLYYSTPDRIILQELCNIPTPNPVVDPYLFVHILNVQIHQKGIANRYALGSLSIACGVALFAIGLSLFLIGADGAFKVQASCGGSFPVAASGTAPGLLCFIAATVLVGIGATRKHELAIGNFRPPVPSAVWHAGSQPDSAYDTSESTKASLNQRAERIRQSLEGESR